MLHFSTVWPLRMRNVHECTAMPLESNNLLTLALAFKTCQVDPLRENALYAPITSMNRLVSVGGAFFHLSRSVAGIDPIMSVHMSQKWSLQWHMRVPD